MRKEQIFLKALAQLKTETTTAEVMEPTPGSSTQEVPVSQETPITEENSTGPEVATSSSSALDDLPIYRFAYVFFLFFFVYFAIYLYFFQLTETPLQNLIN